MKRTNKSNSLIIVKLLSFNVNFLLRIIQCRYQTKVIKLIVTTVIIVGYRMHLTYRLNYVQLKFTNSV